MFGLFKKKYPDPILEYIRNQDIQIAEHEAEMRCTPALNVKPSVEGNKVIFDAPELETFIECDMGNGNTLKINTGSVGLHGNRKIFKNTRGQTTRIELFNPIVCRLTYE